MRKIAIFTEGQGELIFVRRLLEQMMGSESFCFECFKLHKGGLYNVPYSYKPPHATKAYLLVNVGGDEKVLSAIRERQDGLIAQGYDLIIGLRDMYSEAYRKRAQTIDTQVTTTIIQQHQATIQKMNHADKIHLFFAIMEFEAWLLAMPKLFERHHPKLNSQYIATQLGFDLQGIDPEVKFFHPANQLKAILALIGEKYRKGEGQMESLLSHLGREELDDVLAKERPRSLARFLAALWHRNEDSEE